MTVEIPRLGPVQAMRKLVLFGAILALMAVFALTRSKVYGGDLHEVIEWAGIFLIVVCILGRCWCSLYIGGRKIRELVTTGPYSLCRNPLYAFSFIGAAGAMAQSGSLVITAVGALICWAVFRIVVIKEEKLLTAVHGEAYLSYMATTPRFMPNFRLWADSEVLEVRPKRIVLTLADGLAFLLIIPVAELFEWLQEAGVIPVLLNLP